MFDKHMFDVKTGLDHIELLQILYLVVNLPTWGNNIDYSKLYNQHHVSVVFQ